jgi:hypothetical protein
MPPLPLRMVMVRAAVSQDGLRAMVYATEGFEIPHEWTNVQLTPHVALALRAGDLEELGPGDRPLSRSEVEQKYGSGPLQTRAIHRPFRPPVRREQSAEGKRGQGVERLPASKLSVADVQAPVSARRGRPNQEEARRVKRRNEWVRAAIAAGATPTQAYKQAAAKFEDSPETVGNAYARFLRTPPKTKPTK